MPGLAGTTAPPTQTLLTTRHPPPRCAGAHAQTSASPTASKPDDNASSVTIRGHDNNAVGTSDAASQGVIERELLKSRLALRPGEVLEFIPGLIVTQHSGGGKANQYFLRGVNLDHGTDFATRIDGMPVHMPTHAHGQGYTGLNFLIPELVQRMAYRKGLYFAGNGDFASAGSADNGPQHGRRHDPQQPVGRMACRWRPGAHQGVGLGHPLPAGPELQRHILPGFLERPDDGDQLRQDDKRTVLGLDASQTVSHTLLGLQARTDIGLTLRQDRIRVGLFDTLQRRITSVVREDEATVRELGPWSASLQWRYLGPGAVFDRHVHPAGPRMARLTLQMRF